MTTLRRFALAALLVAVVARSAAAADLELYKVPLGNSPAVGAARPKVTIVIFSDFQCPFCARVEPTLKELFVQYGSDLRLVWKNNPLPFHQNARPAALAALAAHQQGKFWPMHDKLFANQQQLDDDSFKSYARELGLDLVQFDAVRASSATDALIQADQDLATKLGARGTPSFFVNGRPIVGAQPKEKFETLIKEELARANGLLANGVPAERLYDELTRSGLDSKPTPAPSAIDADRDTTVMRALVGNSPVRGPADAKVTIILYTDFQCPFCGRVEPTLAQLLDLYGKDLRLVVKQNPLPCHPNAHRAAEAALAARAQGGDAKYWLMHQKLFANQQALDRDSLVAYARELGLDTKRFENDLDNGRFTKAVDDDLADAGKLGVTGTPSFYINGKRFVGAQPLDAFRTRIDAELKNADALLAKGTPRARLYDEIMKSAKVAPPKATPTPEEPEETKVYTFEPGRGPALGPRNAPVTIVELIDFQCPFCRRAADTMKQVVDKYPGKVRLVVRHYPLPFHQNAELAAMAALAAHDQGKFWPMHDKLFANQQALDRDSLEKYAEELQLDISRFRMALDSPQHKLTISEDKRYADSVLSSLGTPTFLVNGRLVPGAQPLEKFAAIIDEELAKKRSKKSK